MEPNKEHIDWERLLRDQVTGNPKISMTQPTAKKNPVYNIRYTMKPADIMTFVGGLHTVQADMIETVVTAKQAQGFPEATSVINHIRAMK